MVSRISFYRNYDDKEDVISEYMKEQHYDWQKEFNQTPNQTEDEILGNIFAYLSYHKDFYLLLNKRNLSYLLKDMITGILDPKPEYENFLAYTLAFISNGIYGWIEEWFSRGMIESAEEMTELLKKRNLNM